MDTEWFAMNGHLPDWMKSRGPIPEDRHKHTLRIVQLVSLAALGVAFAGTLILAAIAIADHAAWFYLTVIAAGAIILVVMFIHPVQGNLRTGTTLLVAAVAANYALLRVGNVTGNTSSSIALVFGILYSGLCALLLLSRSGLRLDVPAKVALGALLLSLCVAGPVMYLSGLMDGAMGGLTEFFLLLSVPMIPLSLGTFLVLSAAHRSEVTLPSDKWI